MTDLMDQLRDVGNLNDSWAVTQGAQGQTPLYTLNVAPTRRPYRLMISGAAAAVVLLAGLGYLMVDGRDDAPLPVASPASTVAFVPQDVLDPGFTILLATYAASWDVSDQVIYVPESSGNSEGRVTVVIQDGATPSGFGELVEHDGVSGQLLSHADPSAADASLQTLSIDIAASSRSMLLTAALDEDLVGLFELAAAIDPELDLSSQEPVGWRLLGSHQDAFGHADHRFYLARSSSGSELAGSAWSDVAPDAEWFILPIGHTDPPAQFGARSVFVHHAGSKTTATWFETPTTLMQLHLTNPGLDPQARSDQLVDYIGRLQPIDQATWDDLVTSPSPPPSPTGDELREAERRRQEQAEREREARRQQEEAEQRLTER